MSPEVISETFFWLMSNAGWTGVEWLRLKDLEAQFPKEDS